MTPAGTSNELDVQNGWEENTVQLLRYYFLFFCPADHERDWPPFVCVCVFSFWTSSSLDVSAGVTQEEGHTVTARGFWNWIIGTGWNWTSGNNRVRCSPDWSVYRRIERYCMTPRQRDDDNNLSVGNRNHLKLGIEPESWLQSHELGF